MIVASTAPVLSVAIPAHNEERTIARCIESIATSAPAVATLDADSWMAPSTVGAILERVNDPRTIGGGTGLWPERMSVGIFLSLLAIAPYV